MNIEETLERIARQESELQFAKFDHETAWELGGRLRNQAAARHLAVVVDVRRFEQPLFFAALAGSTPDNANWVRRKSNTVARFLRSSYAIGLELKAKNSDLTVKYALPECDYAAHGGSFPIAVRGAGVIGSVTVSGLPQWQDHDLVVEALCAMLGRAHAEFRLGDPQ